MENLLLTDENLKGMITLAKISQAQKDQLISKLPELDEDDRLKLLNMLKNVFLLDKEKEEKIQNVRSDWEGTEE